MCVCVCVCLSVCLSLCGVCVCVCVRQHTEVLHTSLFHWQGSKKETKVSDQHLKYTTSDINNVSL